ncbi:PadR family transcriptional regulator [Gordonia terrae]|uniref:PadR family transcriptional regulator n=2 Tax=Gordonia terrae TaxID=2055 RepID=A0AAD0K9S6_9ACTN|nr:PadR family transcriptional regulator [Gordonia terrae]VTR09653.1 PadR family transcriptional regulator [Clostridioides difficile]ANY22259.1 PadR family transcriptional regulator [Gordonia terrae]AWO82997.1 PadR family transcriptional regulator [Gordonia terrae]VTS30736.1 Transcriptional regulator PadR-like family [Gordonia terrae]GAB46267.1 putative PadR family transcriptional regulator [Gordonia terrae NBRC 100016]
MGNDAAHLSLPATSWAVLGMLSFGEELTGNDLKKWADWSIGFFYWSPSVSQVYAELKKLEERGLVASRVVTVDGERGRRLYGITDDGVAALRDWSRDAEVELPVLKHSVMLRLWMGHIAEPDELKKLVLAHIDNLTERARSAAAHGDHSDHEPAWAFSQMSLRWSQRYFDAEIQLARELLDDIDEAARRYRDLVRHDDHGLPIPRDPGFWRRAVDD